MTEASASRVVDRVLVARVLARQRIRSAALMAVSDLRTASESRLLQASLIGMAEGALIPAVGMPREAGLGSLLRKFKQVVQAVRRAPGLWERVKELIGVESLDELPGRLKELAREGAKYLRKALDAAFEKWPLKLYTLPESRLFSLNFLLEKLMKLSPSFEKFLRENVKPRIDQFDKWMKENLPHLSRVLMVAIYVWIWLNVVEFEWNLKDLLNAATGALSLSDLLSSFPASVLGFLMNSLGLGTFTLLPAAIVARFVFLVSARYVSFDGGSIRLDRDKISEDFGIPIEETA